MDAQTLIKSVELAFDLGEFDRIPILARIQLRASELKQATTISCVIASYKKIDNTLAKDYGREVAVRESSVHLLRDENGKPRNTIDNFLAIMREDPIYSNVHYNVLQNAPEFHTLDEVRLWEDADASESRRYIETEYGVHNEKKHHDALRIFFRERKYHPIQDIVDSLEWDGQDRIEAFLTRWMRAEDSDYVREVGRLIFAGGIHRLYEPGCKFDDVPVLIGTNQGEGKSTIVRWLAIHDSFFCEVKEVEGQASIEKLQGAWICEVAELLALTKAREQESVKSFITAQRDKYRKPYAENVSEQLRRCTFIGTTNSEQFLKDKTGNRRFYPVRVKSSGYWLFDHETECREYILQCWAEAKYRFDRHEIPNVANRALLSLYKAAQEEAMEDDWREGAIEQFLDRQPEGGLVCVRQIAHEALSVNLEFPKDPTAKESQEIGILMNKFKDWERAGVNRVKGYGPQKSWRRVTVFTEIIDKTELPF